MLGVEGAQEHINMLWRYNQGTLLYLSSGAGRGIELTRVHPFKDFQEHFNCLRFEMRSEKNVRHGVDNNRQVPHFVPGTLSRYIIIANVVIYPAVTTSSTLTVPSVDEGPAQASLMFREVFLQQTDTSQPSPRSPNESTKIWRDFIGQIMNYISPMSCGKFTTTPETAAQLHHSADIHSQYYSSEVMTRLNTGEIVRLPFSVAKSFFKALGEQEIVLEDTVNRNYTTINSTIYDAAAKRAFNDSQATCTCLQMQAIKSIDDKSDHRDVVGHIATGQGKSAIWNLPLLARAICGSVRQRSIVICPYNSLIAQHVIKSKQCFNGTNLIVCSIITSQLEMATSNTETFDILYISIDAFNVLRQSYKSVLDSWDVKVIFVDEFHLALTEYFCHDNSWASLRDLKSLNTKIVLLSATTNRTATRMITTYVGINGNYIMVGGAICYAVPNVSFRIKSSQSADLINDIVDNIKSHLSQPHSERLAIHVITISKESAMSLTSALTRGGVTAEWLTSDCNAYDRQVIIQKWDSGSISVLASTYCVGLDNSKVKKVIIMGGCRSAADALQSAGRIRPRQQFGESSEVIFWKSDNTWNRRSDETITSQEYRVQAHLFDAFRDESSRASAKAEIASLYEIEGLEGIFYGVTRQCIMRGLHSRMGVETNDCGICEYCQSNISHQLTSDARQREEQRHQDRMFVLSVLPQLMIQCIICNDCSCDGFKCVVGEGSSGHYCRRCMGFTGKGSNNYHTNVQCRLSVKNTKTEGKSCPYCFVAIGGQITGCGDMSQHQQGKCVFRDRVKRILLHDFVGSTDQGLAAQRKMDCVLQNHRLWFELMAVNIKSIYESKK